MIKQTIFHDFPCTCSYVAAPFFH